MELPLSRSLENKFEGERSIKQQIISEVVQQMLPHLDNAQMQQLQKVLDNALFGCEITAQAEKKETDDNPKLIDAFVSAKRIEGCSEKTLKYYRTTIETMVASINKGIRHIQTEDLRSYLTDYQSKNQSSRVTIDNIRRILSSFFLAGGRGLYFEKSCSPYP